ncbi:glycoside hydrolase family 99-like domain-containing protein, partial [Thermodesulfobacteriota bacterium]
SVFQYATIAQSYLDRSYGDSRVFKTVFPAWDNTARTGNRALIVLNGTPDNYEYWLSSTIDKARRSGDGDRLVFINAWNEWAEGCHLEPDHLFGNGYLQATLNAKRGLRRFAAFPDTSPPHAQGLPQRKFWNDIGATVMYHASLRLTKLRLAVNRRPWLHRLLMPLVRVVRGLL